MNRNSTRFLTYDEIDVTGTDLLADAFGAEVNDPVVERLLGLVSIDPPPRLVETIIRNL